MVVHWVHLESKYALQMDLNAFEFHFESVFALQMYPMRYHSAYGPYLWLVCAMIAHWVYLGEQRCSSKCTQMHWSADLGAFGEHLCSPNVPNALS